MNPLPPSPLGESQALRATLAHVSRVAPLERPVLVIGERGTGKELIAARIHYLSRRWDRNFVKVNCAALSEQLLDSELFGHEIGSFTGAVRRQIGRFERADHGTLFLDEIATASMAVQEKLLRAVEYGEIERIGGALLNVDTRVVGATNADLPAMAEAGRFRPDLLDRLAFDVVTLPPLRARPEDIPLLAEHFALGMIRELDRTLFPGFTGRAMQALLDHHWPGNIRELRNAIERSVAATDPEEPIETIILDPFASPWAKTPPVPEPGPVGVPVTPQDSEPPASLTEHMQQEERRLLAMSLEQHRFNQRRTADALGLSYHQLRGLLRKHGLTGAAGKREAAGQDKGPPR